ncbi:MAG: membrane dipeptidase, partial [Deltaproteobacteria bacterium]|nr:membrane dipeptidase [Deltaproteobacteria bacterium]
MRGIFSLCLLAFVTAGCCSGDDNKPQLDLVGAKADSAPQKPPPIESETPVDVHQQAFVVDLIQDLWFRKKLSGWTLTTAEAHVNVDKLDRGGVDLVFAALAPEPGKRPLESLEQGLAAMEELIAGTDGRVQIVTCIDEARAARTKGVIPMMLVLEGADALDGDLGRLYELSRKGIKMIGLVGPRGNGFGDSSVAPSDPPGLTDQGVELIAACRDNGIVVDLTHASETLFWDVIVEQGCLAAVSHGAARALRQHQRNLNDLQILALARSGGVMGLVFNPELLRPGQSAGARIEHVVAHVLHARRIGAVEAIALGTDFGGIKPPAGLEDVAALPAFTDALRAEGLSDAEIRGVLGDNALRVIEGAERNLGSAEVAGQELARPIALECEVVIGDFDGTPVQSCDRYLLRSGPVLPPASRQKLRLREMDRRPDRLEIFGEPGTPWQ